MIQLNELRIGNYYEANGRIFLMDMKMMYAFGGGKHPYVLENIEPIPLTPEILEKCGFEKQLSPHWLDKNLYGSLIKQEDGFYIEDNEGMVYINDKPIISLHQLQNIYFDLTGKELTVNIHANTTIEK